MSNSQPKVTVFMPVYNGELYLREAIDSILNQTFTDFEFLIIDDGSKDASVALIKTYTDERIRLIANPINQGLRVIANQANRLAKAEYIARMDCDDISLPHRLAIQVEYLDQHPEIAVVGAQSIYIDTKDEVLDSQNMLRCAAESSSIRWTASYECPFVNPLVMFRKQVLWEELGGYDETATYAEDYEIWLRLLSNNYQGANLPDVLLRYRVNPKSMMNSANITTRLNALSPMRKKYLDGLIPGFDREKEIINNYFNTHNHELAAAANTALDTLRNQYISIYLNGQITKDLSINIARERARIGYSLFSIDRWKATSLMLQAIWQYPGLCREIPFIKTIYLILFGASGRELIRSFRAKSN